MSSAIHCDGLACTAWTVSTASEAGYISIQKKYKYKHFCSWVCLGGWIGSADLMVGPEDMP
jgi:hypothetical protein